MTAFTRNLLADSAPGPNRREASCTGALEADLLGNHDPARPPRPPAPSARDSEPVAQDDFESSAPPAHDSWVEETVAQAERKAAARRARPLRPERVKPSPRCPICGDFIGKRAYRYVDGKKTHRSCLGDGGSA